MRWALTMGIALAAAGAASAAQDPAPAVPAALDHVILGIDSLERGVRLLREATGVAPVVGGVHPGRGTRNALMALGDGRYLELLAPNYADTASAALMRDGEVGSLRTLTPIGWAFHAPDADAARTALVAAGLPASAVRPGARTRPDGRRLSWRTVQPWGPKLGAAHDAVLPFLIAWGAGTPHPATDSPGGCTLDSLTAVSPAADSVGALLARAGVPTRVRRGAGERLELVLRCPKGRVAFP